MSWFAARMLFESTHQPHPSPDPLFEDRIVLLQAASEEKARRKADELGQDVEREETFQSVEGNEVTWRFKGVLDLKALLDEEIRDGTEVYYAFLDREDAERLRHALSQPAPARQE